MPLNKFTTAFFTSLFIFLSACTKSEGQKLMDEVKNSHEAQFITKKTYSSSDIYPLAITVGRLNKIKIEHFNTQAAEDAKMMLKTIASKGVSLHRNLKRNLKKYQESALNQLDPIINESKKIAKKAIDHKNTRAIFHKAHSATGQCRAFYFGRELDKDKTNLVLAKVTEIGKREIKGKIIVDTRRFNIKKMDHFIKAIDTEIQFYNYQVRDSIKIDCNKAYSLQAKYLDKKNIFNNLLMAQAQIDLLRKHVSYAGASRGEFK